MKIISAILLIHILGSTIAAPVQNNFSTNRSFWRWIFGRILISNNPMENMENQGSSPFMATKINRSLKSFLCNIFGCFNQKPIQDPDTETESSEGFLTKEEITEELVTEVSLIEETESVTESLTESSQKSPPPVFENSDEIDYTDCHPAYQLCDVVGIYTCNTTDDNTICGIRYKSRRRNERSIVNLYIQDFV